MITGILGAVTVDADQQRGGLTKDAPIEDFQRDGAISTASDLRFHLCVVADGGGKQSPDMAAKLAVDTVFAECSRARGSSPGEILNAAFVAANRAVFQMSGGRDYVGMTAAAVKDNSIYIAQAGRLTQAYLIDAAPSVDPKPFPLGNDRCLGDADAPPEIALDSARFKSGGRLVVCSDGLFDPPGDDAISAQVRKKLQEGLKIVGHYDDLSGSARYLSSIAKGMDVTDDISVMVVGLGRKPKKLPQSTLLIAAVAIPIVIVGLLLAARKPEPPIPADGGSAVLVSGSAIDVITGNNIIQGTVRMPPGTQVVIPEAGPAAFILMTPIIKGPGTPVPDASAQPIMGISLYLSPQSEMTFTRLDSYPYIGEERAADAFLNLTELTLKSGRLLLNSNGGRTYTVLIDTGENREDVRITLKSSGGGAMGVAREGQTVTAFCLRGACEVTTERGTASPIASEEFVTLDAVNAELSGPSGQISDAGWQVWSDICRVYQPSNCQFAR